MVVMRESIDWLGREKQRRENYNRQKEKLRRRGKFELEYETIALTHVKFVSDEGGNKLTTAIPILDKPYHFKLISKLRTLRFITFEYALLLSFNFKIWPVRPRLYHL